MSKSIIKIGAFLHRGEMPEVKNYGIVSLPTQHETQKENNNEKARKPGKTRRSRKARSRRKTRRYGKTCARSSLIGTKGKNPYTIHVRHLGRYYPGLMKRDDENGSLILRVPSKVMPELNLGAVFIIIIPLLPAQRVSSWGFWKQPNGQFQWMGPRHTNFPDGSICAFEPKDDTWLYGDSLITLCDLYSLWAFRHLHLRMIGTWPGAQFVPLAYERRLEIGPKELCGCKSPKGNYSDCCMAKDFYGSLQIQRKEFETTYGPIENRTPPANIQMLLENPWMFQGGQ